MTLPDPPRVEAEKNAMAPLLARGYSVTLLSNEGGFAISSNQPKRPHKNWRSTLPSQSEPSRQQPLVSSDSVRHDVTFNGKSVSGASPGIRLLSSGLYGLVSRRAFGRVESSRSREEGGRENSELTSRKKQRTSVIASVRNGSPTPKGPRAESRTTIPSWKLDLRGSRVRMASLDR